MSGTRRQGERRRSDQLPSARRVLIERRDVGFLHYNLRAPRASASSSSCSRPRNRPRRCERCCCESRSRLSRVQGDSRERIHPPLAHGVHGDASVSRLLPAALLDLASDLALLRFSFSFSFARLGATAEQIEEQEKSAFEKNSRYGLLEVEGFDPAAEAPTAETWTRFINGDEENELLLRRFWRASIRERGRSESVGACLAELWPGLQSRLHHGPIRLA